jgi:hypothetical protein
MKYPRSTNEAIDVLQRFESLPLEKRLEIFGGLSAEARNELVQVLHRPGEIIRRVSEEEMYFTIKELGPERALDLIASTTGKQLQYLLDIELWDKDALDAEAARRWIEILAAIGVEKVIQFIQVVDDELLQACLHQLIRVTPRDPDVDLLEQLDSLPHFTLDEYFFIEFMAPDSEESAKRVLEAVFHWSPEAHYRLMVSLMSASYLEGEEIALKWRRSRLADHGIPGFDEAVEIYRYLSPGGAFTPVRCPDADDATEQGPYPRVIHYPTKHIRSDNLFGRALALIEDQGEINRIALELAHLANKVMIADDRDPGSMSDLTAALEKVDGYINLALERRRGADNRAAAELLRATHTEILFRSGFSAVLDLRRQATRLVGAVEGGVENLGHPLAELLKGLFQKRPIFAANALASEKPREFRSAEDLEIIRRLINPSRILAQWEPL